jgi:hypothetical protein
MSVARHENNSDSRENFLITAVKTVIFKSHHQNQGVNKQLNKINQHHNFGFLRLSYCYSQIASVLQAIKLFPNLSILIKYDL